MTSFSIRTYILNIKRRSDRRKMMQESLPDGLISEFTSDWGVDFDWRNIDTELLHSFGLFPWKIKSDNPWWNRSLKKGEVACAIAHWECWHHALETTEDTFLFLEDDVSFTPGFMRNLESTLNKLVNYDSEWDLLYLGREPLDRDEEIAKGIVKPGYSYGAYAYMLTREAVDKLTNTGFKYSLIPVDEFLPAMYIDHPRLDVRQVFHKKLHAYAIESDIVRPPDQSLYGSDTENSDFVS